MFAIPAANRPGFTGYFIPTPPSSYRNQAWMSYAGENELPSQWADSVRPSLIPCLTHFREIFLNSVFFFELLGSWKSNRRLG